MILHHMYMNDKNNVTIILPDKFFVGGKKGRDYIGNSNCGCTLLNIYTYSGFTYMIIFFLCHACYVKDISKAKNQNRSSSFRMHSSCRFWTCIVKEKKIHKRGFEFQLGKLCWQMSSGTEDNGRIKWNTSMCLE